MIEHFKSILELTEHSYKWFGDGLMNLYSLCRIEEQRYKSLSQISFGNLVSESIGLESLFSPYIYLE